MAKKKKTKKKAATKKPRPKTGKDTARLWLMYPQKLVQQPVIYQLGQKFDVVTNVRQATVHDDVGLISLEILGKQEEIDKSIKWLEKKGIKVEPVEINVIAS